MIKNTGAELNGLDPDKEYTFLDTDGGVTLLYEHSRNNQNQLQAH